ncbi:membrane protein insertase YidC [Rhodohalobacter sp. 8-1]|uniref:membrane protein insertase YidC n=1 Tax=Rhodohalobacter sp. 8-1 TaxID=3131972 RepID=UPI0030EDE3C4
MDRNTITGLLLIFAITIAWAFYSMPSEEELQQQRAQQAIQDSIAAAEARERGVGDPTEPSAGQQSQDTQTPSRTLGQQDQDPALGAFENASYGDTTRTLVRTPIYEAEFTNLGAGPSKFTLRDYERWDQQPMQMIRDTTRSAYSLGFLSAENYNIESNNILFEPLYSSSLIEIAEGESEQLRYQLQLDDDSRIIYTYTFYGDRYEYELDIEFQNMLDYISDSNVDFGWVPSLNISERDTAQDQLNSAAHVYTGGELEKLQLTDAGSQEQIYSGTIDWVSTKTRFFAQFIKPLTNSNAALLRGEVTGTVGESGALHHYQSFVTSNIVADNVLEYEFYVGPLRYQYTKNFDEHAYDVVEIGYALIRWFADPLVRYLIIPFFTFGSMLIPNYGILIILFGIIIKVVLFPLTQKSFKSMAAMKDLQPQMQELKEKYKDDPQKQQKETIALYKKAGVNPLGGCLPMLLQFPILITLFFFFQNSMIIRQEPFLWASDLAAPDYILSLPFSIPFLGDQVAGFVLLMTAAMFVQTKLTGSVGGMGGGASPSGGPNMKAFTYVLPFILLFVFNNFAAGLSLYYLVYNVLSAAQQVLIKKQTETPAVETKGKGKGGKKKKGKKK